MKSEAENISLSFAFSWLSGQGNPRQTNADYSGHRKSPWPPVTVFVSAAYKKYSRVCVYVYECVCVSVMASSNQSCAQQLSLIPNSHNLKRYFPRLCIDRAVPSVLFGAWAITIGAQAFLLVQCSVQTTYSHLYMCFTCTSNWSCIFSPGVFWVNYKEALKKSI